MHLMLSMNYFDQMPIAEQNFNLAKDAMVSRIIEHQELLKKESYILT